MPEDKILYKAQALADERLRQQDGRRLREQAVSDDEPTLVNEKESARARHRFFLLEHPPFPNTDPAVIRIETEPTKYEAVDASSVNENEGFLSILTPKSSKKAKATTLKQIADHFGLDSAWLLRIQQSVYEGFESVVQKLRPGTLIFLEEDAPEDEHEKAPDVKVMKPRKRPRQQAPPPPPRPGHLLPLARPIAQRSDGDSRRSEDIDGVLVFSPLRRRRSAATVAGHSGTGVGPSGTALRAASCVIGKRGRPPKTSSQSDNVLRTWPTRQHRVTVSKAKSAVLELQAYERCMTRSRGQAPIRFHVLTAAQLSATDLQFAFELLKSNMRELYADEWSDVEKRKELTHSDARYLIGSIDDEAVAYLCFRFTLEEKVPVLYVYELQLQHSVHRQGVGRWMMAIIERIGREHNMMGVLLTCFRHNRPAMDFYMQRLSYSVCAISPSCCHPTDEQIVAILGPLSADLRVDQPNYEILAKLWDRSADQVFDQMRERERQSACEQLSALYCAHT